MDEEELVDVGDETPTLKEQARLNGWRADLFDFGTRNNEEGVDLFNPGLVQRPDGLWLIVRRSEDQPGMMFGKNGLWACQLKDRKPFGGPLLSYPDSAPSQQFEDARAIYWNNQVWISACNFTWHGPGDWTGAHQVMLIYRNDEEWTPIARKDPAVGKNRDSAGPTNGQHEKNWIFFTHENRLHLLYHTKPWRVIQFGETWDEQTHYIGPDVTSKFGDIRGGTPPILHDGLYWTFWHSSLPWRGRFRRYYMGALAFEPTPPFKPVRLTQNPLLTGSQNDPWKQGKPLVVFPCGAIIENDIFFITYGVNDAKCGFVEIPYEDIVKLAEPIVDPAQSLIADPAAAPRLLTSVQDFISEEIKDDDRKAKLAENLAKARKALAEKRARGEIKMKPRRRVRRKKLKQAVG